MNVKGHAPARHHAEEARAVLHLQVGKMEQEGYQAEGGDPEQYPPPLILLPRP